MHQNYPLYGTCTTSSTRILSAAINSADLAFPCGYGGVSVNEPREDSSQRLDAEGEGGHVQEDHIGDITSQNTSLDRSTNSNSLIRIDRTTRGTTKDLLNSLLNLKQEKKQD